MQFPVPARFSTLLNRQVVYCLPLLFALPAAATVTITSPAASSTSISAVKITATATGEGGTFNHLEIWDNNGSGGYKLGNVSSTSVNVIYVLPKGSHTLTVNAVTSGGTVLDGSSVSYTVAESCNSSTTQCDFDQLGIDNTQNDCSPPQEDKWVANPCGAGIQGSGGTDPTSTDIVAITETGTIPDAGNTTLNGKSIHLSETQGSGGLSNVLFKADSPNAASTTQVDTHWVMDEYVYLPNPAAHQAFEVDAQYIFDGVWTKFYTECAFNISSGTGYWAVFGGSGGWAFLNGTGGAPTVPCNRSQFAAPLSGAGNSSFTGWHHIVWTFLRNDDTHGNGYVTYVSLTFDGTTYSLNYTPTYATGGSASNNGDFSALVQLDGVSNPSGTYDTVDAYINELNITHTP